MMCLGDMGRLYVIGIFPLNISKEYSHGIFAWNILEFYVYIYVNPNIIYSYLVNQFEVVL